MKQYLKENKEYWEKGYPAYNVDHNVFRAFGRVLKDYPKGKLLDFGCGQGATVNFFNQVGYKAYGVDISENDINAAKIRYPYLSNQFKVCDPDPALSDYGEGYAVITAVQSLYYLSDEDFKICMKKLYDSLEEGGIFYATMMGTKSKEFFDNSKPYKGNLRVVNFKNERLNVKNYYMFFIENEEDLKNKFKMFEPLHIGYYCAKFRNDEGDG